MKGAITTADGAIAMVMGAEVAWTGLPLSLTAAVNVELPLTSGMPMIVPVVGFRSNPAGSCPDAIDHL